MSSGVCWAWSGASRFYGEEPVAQLEHERGRMFLGRPPLDGSVGNSYICKRCGVVYVEDVEDE